MPNKRLNTEIENRLSNYASEINNDDLWQAIEPRLKQEEQRRVIPWFWLVGFVVLLAGLVYYFADYSGQEYESDNDIAIENRSNNIFFETDHDTKVEEVIALEIDDTQVDNDVEERTIIPIAVNAEKQREYVQKDKPVLRSSKLQVVASHHIQNDTRQGKSAISIVESENELESGLTLHELESLSPLNISLINSSTRDIIQPQTVFLVKPHQEKKYFIDLAFGIGRGLQEVQTNSEISPVILDGIDLMHHNLQLAVGRKVSRNFYALAGLRWSRYYKDLQASISRDSIVPSPKGAQLLELNTLSNGQLLERIGVPNVVAKYSRSKRLTNKIDVFSAFVGLGFTKRLGRISWDIEIAALWDAELKAYGSYVTPRKHRFFSLESGQANELSSAWRWSGKIAAAYRFSSNSEIHLGLRFDQNWASRPLQEYRHKYGLAAELGSRYCF